MMASISERLFQRCSPLRIEGDLMRRPRWLLTLASAATLALTIGPMTAAAQGDVSISHVPVPIIAGQAYSSDGADIDQSGHRLYVTDRTIATIGGVDVFDISGPQAKFLGTIGLPQRSSGLVVAENLKKVYVG